MEGLSSVTTGEKRFANGFVKLLQAIKRDLRREIQQHTNTHPTHLHAAVRRELFIYSLLAAKLESVSSGRSRPTYHKWNIDSLKANVLSRVDTSEKGLVRRLHPFKVSRLTWAQLAVFLDIINVLKGEAVDTFVDEILQEISVSIQSI